MVGEYAQGKPVQVALVIDVLECYVNLAGPHVHLDGNQIVVLDLPEPSLQKSPAVIAPGQVIEQATGKTVTLVHFDVLGLDQTADFSLADVCISFKAVLTVLIHALRMSGL